MAQKYELRINSGDGENITIDAQPFHDMLAAHNERPSANWKERAKQLAAFVGFPVEDWSMVDFENEDGNFAGEDERGR